MEVQKNARNLAIRLFHQDNALAHTALRVTDVWHAVPVPSNLPDLASSEEKNLKRKRFVDGDVVKTVSQRLYIILKLKCSRNGLNSRNFFISAS